MPLISIMKNKSHLSNHVSVRLCDLPCVHTFDKEGHYNFTSFYFKSLLVLIFVSFTCLLEGEKFGPEKIRNQLEALTPQYEELDEITAEGEDPLRLAEGTPLWKNMVSTHTHT